MGSAFMRVRRSREGWSVMTQNTSNTAPGWYVDPSNTGNARYWDGAKWTEHVRPCEAPPAKPVQRVPEVQALHTSADRRAQPQRLVACPDCAHNVSPAAAACPNCGRPLNATTVPSTTTPGAVGHTCPYCRSGQVGKIRGLQGVGEVAVAFLLTLLFLIPGIIYYIYIESVPYCSGCGRRVRFDSRR